MVLTYKQKFNIKYGFPKDQSHSIRDIAKITGYKESGLKTIFEKGKGAYYSNPSSVRPVVKKQGGAVRWGYARVLASVNPKSKAHKVDKVHLIKS